MKLKGSCHCGAVRFSIQSETPYPYMWCYCHICRKTAGGGGYAINIMGKAETLKAKGKTRSYRATRGGGERHFWSEWIYSFASAIDTPLPTPKERQHFFLSSKPGWVKIAAQKGDQRFREYPKEAIIDWHRHRGLLGP